MYKLKHVPSGLYYQPHRHRGSNLSKHGKIYQTKTHGLSSALRQAEKYKDKPQYQLFDVFVQIDSVVYRQFKDQFQWKPTLYDPSQLKASTNLSDWIIETIIS
jgi:hypothetical protein